METLAANKARPFVRPVDISQSPLPVVMRRYSEFKGWLPKVDGKFQAKPEDDALWFYMMNHAMAAIAMKLDENSPLGEFEPYVLKYHQAMQAKSLRMFYYLLLICTRESRHGGGDGMKKLYAKYPDIKEYHKNHVLDSAASESINAILNKAPNVTLGRYCQFLHDAFIDEAYSKSFGGDAVSYSHSYGGEAWRQCAQPLRDFVFGKISAEMLLDTGFTLCHNGGPIFNKGMLYTSYNPQELEKILDVQRSGQIPQLVGNKETVFVTQPLLEMQSKLFQAIGPEFGGVVDWSKVTKLGAKGKYKPSKVDEYLNAFAEPAQSKFEKMKAKAAEKKKLKEKMEFMAKHLEVLPGVWVEKKVRNGKEG